MLLSIWHKRRLNKCRKLLQNIIISMWIYCPAATTYARCLTQNVNFLFSISRRFSFERREILWFILRFTGRLKNFSREVRQWRRIFLLCIVVIHNFFHSSLGCLYVSLIMTKRAHKEKFSHCERVREIKTNFN